MKEAENMKQGVNMEKLLLERVMLRKELKLRNMQEKLLDQTQKLEVAEKKLAEYEGLPGLTQFIAIINLGRDVFETGRNICQKGHRCANCSLAFIYQILIFLSC